MSQKALEQLVINFRNKLFDNKETVTGLKELYSIEKTDTIKHLEMGLVEISGKDSLPEYTYKYFKSFGLLDGKYNGLVAMPLRKKDNRIINFLFLNLNGEAPKLLRKGGLANLKAFTGFKSLVAVDNINDFFAYLNTKMNIVPVIETEGMEKDFIDALALHNTEEVTLLNDSPRWERVKEKLKNTGIKVYEIYLPGNVPVKEYMAGNSGNKLIAYIEAEKAKHIKSFKVNKQPGEEKPYLKVEERTGEVRFHGDDRIYRVRGFNRDGFEKIVQISLEVEGLAFPDKVDLSRSRSRTGFANTAAFEFEMSPELVRNDLAFIYKTLDKIQDKRFKAKAGLQDKNVHILTPDDLTKAKEHLNKRDLLTEIIMKDTERLGYVEEEVNKKLLYLASISRLTGEPLSVLDISPPGTGKSFGISMIMELVPPEELLMYSRLTPNALYYKSEDELKGRVLYIEELNGMEESLESIRMIISAGELAVSVVEKDPRTGQLRTVERRIRVDIPVISSGVRDIFDEETLSRFILTYNDVTEKHINRILKAQAHRYSLEGERVNLQRDRIIKKHRDIQKSFDPSLKVANPFHNKIQMNHKLPIVTRKQAQYLRLIYNIAFIRQHTRDKKKEVDRFGNEIVYIEVVREDIVTANEIAEYVFSFAGCDLTRRLSDAYTLIKKYSMKQVKEKRIGLYEFKFSRREIREYSNLEQTTAKRLFDELETLEYIRKIRGEKQGMQFLYRLVPYHEKKPGNSDLQLLDPDDL